MGIVGAGFDGPHHIDAVRRLGDVDIVGVAGSTQASADRLEICGSTASIKWRQEDQNELWIGHRDTANQIVQKDPSLLDADSRVYAHGGHQEARADAFANLMRDIYGFIAAGKKPTDAHPPAFATFEDGSARTSSSKRFSRALRRAACGPR